MADVNRNLEPKNRDKFTQVGAPAHDGRFLLTPLVFGHRAMLLDTACMFTSDEEVRAMPDAHGWQSPSFLKTFFATTAYNTSPALKHRILCDRHACTADIFSRHAMLGCGSTLGCQRRCATLHCRI